MTFEAVLQGTIENRKLSMLNLQFLSSKQTFLLGL
jgi:hypothetical protein